MSNTRSYREWLINRLRNRDELIAYLEAVITDDPMEPQAACWCATLRGTIRDAIDALKAGAEFDLGYVPPSDEKP